MGKVLSFSFFLSLLLVHSLSSVTSRLNFCWWFLTNFAWILVVTNSFFNILVSAGFSCRDGFYITSTRRPSSQLPNLKKELWISSLYKRNRLNKSQHQKWRIGKTDFSVASTTAASACVLTSFLATNSARMQRLLVKVVSCVEWRPSLVCRFSSSVLFTDKS